MLCLQVTSQGFQIGNSHSCPDGIGSESHNIQMPLLALLASGSVPGMSMQASTVAFVYQYFTLSPIVQGANQTVSLIAYVDK